METQTDSDMALLSSSSSSGGAEPALRHTVLEGIESRGWQKPADSPLKSEIEVSLIKGLFTKVWAGCRETSEETAEAGGGDNGVLTVLRPNE